MTTISEYKEKTAIAIFPLEEVDKQQQYSTETMSNEVRD